MTSAFRAETKRFIRRLTDGLGYYQRMDWLGTARLDTSSSGGVNYDGAYAAFGESYAQTGATDREFAGMAQQQATTGPYPLYDAMFRNYNPIWGRWLSPDSSVDEPVGPAGLAAANPADPQSWTRYAYALSNPHFAIQSQIVCLETPTSRATSIEARELT